MIGYMFIKSSFYAHKTVANPLTEKQTYLCTSIIHFNSIKLVNEFITSIKSNK